MPVMDVIHLITLCKPCFVPSVLQMISLIISYKGGNHLSTGTSPVLYPVHFQDQRFPYQHLGFSLVGFTRSTSPISGRASSLWHFYRVMPYPGKGLRQFPGRQPVKAALAYFFTRHEHYTHLSLCEHGLSSTITISESSDYPNAIKHNMSHYNGIHTKNQWKSYLFAIFNEACT